ncbi:uncharacterized protein LOC110453380 isoform X2 [Mizuhopecten yessoensis]|nr:uncharacterized protein LOC110453380 isoform X2 [Mizuhopecten yessoensis]
MPSVRILKNSYTAEIGDQVTLNCSVSAFPCITSVSWQQVLPDGRIEQLDRSLDKYRGSNSSDPSLVINDIKKYDQGEYTCTVSSCRKIQSASTKLTVNGGPPVLNMNPNSHSKTEGDVAVLKCNVIAKPTATVVKWSKGGEFIAIDNAKYIGGAVTCPSLVITNAEMEHDEGVYTCVAENSEGQGGKNVTLTIQSRKEEPEKSLIDEHIPDTVTKERIVIRHGHMVNDLSDFICPEEKVKWDKFKELLKAFMPPRELSKNFHEIIDYLMQQEHIDYGRYDKLFEVVYKTHKNVSHIIRKAETDIRVLERGVTSEEPVVIECVYDGEYKSELLNKWVSQIEAVLPQLKCRIRGIGWSGSIVLTLTISGAETPHELSALYLAEKVKVYLQKERIVLTDESGEPLKPQTTPKVMIPTKETPTVRFSKGYYQFAEGETAIVRCAMVPNSEVECIEWFRVKDGTYHAIRINNEKYFGGPKSSSLVISDLNEVDKGTYICRTSNGASKAESDIAYIEVQSSDSNPKVAAMLEGTQNKIQEEMKKGFILTKGFRDAQQRLLKNRVVVLKGNTGDGKTVTAVQLLHWLRKEQQGIYPLQINNFEDLDLVTALSQCTIFIDDIFGEKDVGANDVCEWQKRIKSVLPTLCELGNYLLINVSNEVFNSLKRDSSETVFIKSNIIDLSSNEYKIESERVALLELYEPKHNAFSWTDTEKEDVVEFGIGVGFPLCCRLFRDDPCLQEERVNFFRRPFSFWNNALSKLGHYAALFFLFINGDELMEKDLDPKCKRGNKILLEESFEIDSMCSGEDRTKLTHKEKKEFVQKYLDTLLGFLVVKERNYAGDDVYKFYHDSIHATVALLYGKNKPIGYIKNCPRKSLLHLTTSTFSKNMIAISPDLYIDMYTRLLQEIKIQTNHDHPTIDSLQVWTDSQFLEGFIKWLHDITHLSEIKILNKMCSSGVELCALQLLSNGVKPDKDTPFCVIEGGNLKVLCKLLEYDITTTARAASSKSSHDVYNINILHEACVLEREKMVRMLCDNFPHLVHATDSLKQSTLHLVALTGNCNIFDIVEKTVLKSLCRVEDAKHTCESADDCLVHRNCVCAQYLAQLVSRDERTVLHSSCKGVHRELCLYLCQSYPILTTIVDKYGCHCLHDIARYSPDVDMFTECQMQVKQYLESTGLTYDITTLLDNLGRTVLHKSCEGEHNELCLYLCQQYPALSTLADKFDNHSLHYIAKYMADQDIFTKCEAHVKQYFESTGRTYDITAILDYLKRTVLHKSCEGGHKELCLYLCQSYPILTRCVEKNGWHCLHFIARYTPDVDMFIECETRVKQYQKSIGRMYDITTILENRGRTVLHHACKAEHKELCLYLCQSYPALTDVVDKNGWHCLHYITRHMSDINMFIECETHVKRYIASTGRMYDIATILDNDGMTVLHKSCDARNKELCLYLCQTYPALTEVVDRKGCHSRHYIAKWMSYVNVST